MRIFRNDDTRNPQGYGKERRSTWIPWNWNSRKETFSGVLTVPLNVFAQNGVHARLITLPLPLKPIDNVGIQA